MAGAAHNRGKSRQDYSTPQEFIEEFERRFGPINFDLAASAENTKAGEFAFYGVDDDSLTKDWGDTNRRGAWQWLNPPFANIAPWARKCAEHAASASIALLVPASVGANWWRDYVHHRAGVLFLNGRLSFDGVNGFPKDCALCLYGSSVVRGYDVWDWRKASE